VGRYRDDRVQAAPIPTSVRVTNQVKARAQDAATKTAKAEEVHHRFGSFIHVVKQATESRTSTTVLANDAELFFPMEAGRSYRIHVNVYFVSTTAADFQYGVTGPLSPTLLAVSRIECSPLSTPSFGDLKSAYYSSGVTCTSNGTGWVTVEMLVHNGANAGTFAFTWAQNVSDASDTSVLKGSYLEYAEVA
jgi:hypothetical protein